MSHRLPHHTCSALLFDLDGTLVDSSTCIERHWRRWAAKHDLDLVQIMQIHSGRRTIETMRQVAPHLDLPREAAEFGAAEAADTDGIVALAGAAELLATLPAQRWGIVTSCPRVLAINRLTCVGLPIPPVLVTSEDVHNGKPAPDPYLLGAEKLGVAPEACLAGEDAPAGIQSARTAKMTVLAVMTTHARSALTDAHLVVDGLPGVRITQGMAASGQRLLVHIAQ